MSLALPSVSVATALSLASNSLRCLKALSASAGPLPCLTDSTRSFTAAMAWLDFLDELSASFSDADKTDVVRISKNVHQLSDVFRKNVQR